MAGRTLHVLTTAYATGGHTRLVKRWIELSSGERHGVILVRQTEPFDPAWVVPEGADVPLVDLHAEGVERRLDKVARLRGCFETAGRVVLHIHPDDACAVAAVHQVPGLDVHLLNHADHVAWLGSALPATLLNLRGGGASLAAQRRGWDPRASGCIPLPITPPPALDRAQARADLGFDEADVVLLTIATGYKFAPVDGRSLLEPLSEALGHPRARLVAIGPSADHPVFSALAGRHPGKVQALGVLPDPSRHRAAADIYVDSFPFCSPTSMLESAVLGTPVAALQPDATELGILYTECPALPRSAYGSSSASELGVRLLDLVANPVARREAGERMAQGTRIHLPEAWTAALDAYLAVPRQPGAWRDAPAMASGFLDKVLSGLGGDPRIQPKLRKWPLGPLDRLRVLGLRRG